MRNRALFCVLLFLPLAALAQGGPPGGRQVTVETIVVETTELEFRTGTLGVSLEERF